MATNLPIKEVNIEKILQVDSIEDKDAKEKVMGVGVKLIDLKTLNRVLEDLDKDERQELADIIEAEESQKVIDYINDKGIDFVGVVEEKTKLVRDKLSKVIDEYNPNI